LKGEKMTKNRIVVIVLSLVLIFSLTACGGGSKLEANEVGKVNDRVITVEEFNQYYKISMNSYGLTEEQLDVESNGENMLDKFKSDILDELVNMQIIEEYVSNSDKEVDKEESNLSFEKYVEYVNSNEESKKFMEDNNINEEFIKKIFISQAYANVFINEIIEETENVEDDIAKFYADNKEAYRVDEVRASHILVSEEEVAKELLERIRAGEDFAEVAKEASEGPSGVNGGDLGYFAKEKMVAEFSDAAFALEVGEISEPVKTQFGYHLILLVDKREFVPIEDASADIENRIYDTKFIEKIEEVSKEMKIEKSIENIK